jgi:hypothetical protein
MHSLALRKRERDDFGECGFNNTQILTAAASEAATAAVEIAAAAGLGLVVGAGKVKWEKVKCGRGGSGRK